MIPINYDFKDNVLFLTLSNETDEELRISRKYREFFYEILNSSSVKDLSISSKRLYHELIESGVSFDRKKYSKIYFIKSLAIKLTNKCNLNCRHCYQDKSTPYSIQLKPLKTFLTNAFTAGCKHVALTGGEPFVWRGIFDLIKFLNKNEIFFSITSNGQSIPPQKYKSDIISGFFKSINVSLDGFEHEHDLLRGDGTFLRAIEFIKFCRKNGLELNISHTVTNSNYPQFNEFIKYCINDLGAKSITLSTVFPLGNALKNKKIIISDNRLLKKIYTISVLRSGNYICSALSDGITIQENGEVVPCDAYQNNIFGSIYKNSFDFIMKNRESFIINNSTGFGRCEKCVKFRKCKGGCRARAQKYPNYRGVDPFSCFLHINKKLKGSAIEYL